MYSFLVAHTKIDNLSGAFKMILLAKKKKKGQECIYCIPNKQGRYFHKFFCTNNLYAFALFFLSF